MMHNDHVITYFQFRVYICECLGYWMAREFYAEWANQEMERQNEHSGNTGLDRTPFEQRQERRSIPLGALEEA